jgi:hypothetical protein
MPSSLAGPALVVLADRSELEATTTTSRGTHTRLTKIGKDVVGLHVESRAKG